MRDYQRTWTGKLVAGIAARQLKARYPHLEIHGAHHLESAVSLFSRVTLFSAHISQYDINTLDSTIRKLLGNDSFPVFILRNDLTIHIKGNVNLPISLSQYLYVRHCKSIPINQKDMRGFFRITGQLRSAYKGRHVVVIFPGATRHKGAVNGLIPLTVGMYTLLLKRKDLISNHCYLPVGFSYNSSERSVRIAYGPPLPLGEDTDHREAGQHILQAIADLSEVTTVDMCSAGEARAFITSRRNGLVRQSPRSNS